MDSPLDNARTSLEPSRADTSDASRDLPHVELAIHGHIVFVDTASKAAVGSIKLFEAPQSPRVGEIVWIDQRKFTVINVRYEFLRSEPADSESTLALKSIVVLLHRVAQTSASENTPLSST